jgi:thioredoxin-dependent peroxiredoxin
MAIAEGQLAPNFTLQDQDGVEVSLKSLRGKHVVLYFYPKDSTPVCTKEACSFRDATADYEQAGAKVIGISADSVQSHSKFAKKHELPFTLLSDPDRKVCAAYDVWKEKTMYGRFFLGIVRTTFLIDAKGVVRKIFPKVKVSTHSDEVLEAIKTL